jgi:beta-galactosidase
MRRSLWSALLATAIAFTLVAGPVPGGTAMARTAAPGGASPAAAAVTTAVDAHGGRDRSVDLDNDWRFALVNPTGITDPTGAFAGAQDPAFDDSTWRVVDLPHDWSIELDPTSGPGTGTNAGTGFLQGGLGWYRKTFTLAPSLAGKRLSVEFDGVYMDSSVYFNGQLVGSHPYGYTGFSVDLTPLARTDGTSPNVLAVRCRTRFPAAAGTPAAASTATCTWS